MHEPTNNAELHTTSRPKVFIPVGVVIGVIAARMRIAAIVIIPIVASTASAISTVRHRDEIVLEICCDCGLESPVEKIVKIR